MAANRVGQRFGDYRLTRFLGQGTFGEVYIGEHVYDNTQVAVKVLKTQLTDRNDVKAFIKEARAFRLKHPNIVQLLDFDIGDDDTPFLVMDFAPNGTLLQRHPKGTRLPLATIVTYVKQIAAALQYAHDRRLIHRDVKPENMLFGPNNEIWLSDFGIAGVAHGTGSLTIQEIIGTVPYMAPEQFQGKPRPASDQYALGIIVYEWLSGERPFKGNAIEVAMQHSLAPPPPLHEKISTISSEVEQVVMKALAKNPSQRFENVQAFANALEKAGQPKRPVEVIRPVSPIPPAPSMYDVSREPDDPSDLAAHPHEKIFPAKGEKHHLRYGWQIIGASRRGYSHSYEGKYRGDDFTIRFFGNSRQGAEVAIVAIADGVSSKEWSRRGALAAVQGATSMPEQRLQTLISLIEKKGGYQCQQETSNILMEALYAANRSVHECAQRSNVTIDDLQSTLLVFLAVPWDDQRLLVASTQVGDGALFAFQPKKNALPRDKWSWLQHPQIQGAGNEAQPFMRTNIDEWVAAFKCEMVENATCIMGMTDGIADDVEPPRATPEDRQPDPFSRVDDFFQKVSLPSFREPQPAEALVRGLGYMKNQSYDDRTVVCLYRL